MHEMRVDEVSLPVDPIDLDNAKVLIQLEQAEGAKGKKCYHWWAKAEECQWYDSG